MTLVSSKKPRSSKFKFLAKWKDTDLSWSAIKIVIKLAKKVPATSIYTWEKLHFLSVQPIKDTLLVLKFCYVPCKRYVQSWTLFAPISYLRNSATLRSNKNWQEVNNQCMTTCHSPIFSSHWLLAYYIIFVNLKSVSHNSTDQAI